MTASSESPPSSSGIPPELALQTAVAELHELHLSLQARPFRDAVGELAQQLTRAQKELCVRLADDDGPRSGDLRVLRRLDLAFRRVADLLSEGRLNSRQRRILEHAADLLRSVQGYTRAHFLAGRA